MKDLDWDPKPSERVYYRSTHDGQRGYMVRRNGIEAIRLDRPMEELIRELNDGWKRDEESYPLNPHRLAKIAFVADRELAAAIGDRIEPREREWIDLSERERIRFLNDGPDEGGIRDKLHLAIVECLKELAGG